MGACGFNSSESITGGLDLASERKEAFEHLSNAANRSDISDTGERETADRAGITGVFPIRLAAAPLLSASDPEPRTPPPPCRERPRLTPPRGPLRSAPHVPLRGRRGRRAAPRREQEAPTFVRCSPYPRDPPRQPRLSPSAKRLRRGRVPTRSGLIFIDTRR